MILELSVIVFLVIICIYEFYYDKINYKKDKTTGIYVRKEFSDQKAAIEKLNYLRYKINIFMDEMTNRFPNDYRIKNYNERFAHQFIYEGLPDGVSTSYTINKGEKLVICIRDRDGKIHVDDIILLFVIIHELTHIITNKYGHDDEFWDTFQWMLTNAEEILNVKFYDFKKKPKIYCKIKITSNPQFDWKCTDPKLCKGTR